MLLKSRGFSGPLRVGLNGIWELRSNSLLRVNSSSRLDEINISSIDSILANLNRSNKLLGFSLLISSVLIVSILGYDLVNDNESEKLVEILTLKVPLGLGFYLGSILSSIFMLMSYHTLSTARSMYAFLSQEEDIVRVQKYPWIPCHYDILPLKTNFPFDYEFINGEKRRLWIRYIVNMFGKVFYAFHLPLFYLALLLLGENGFISKNKWEMVLFATISFVFALPFFTTSLSFLKPLLYDKKETSYSEEEDVK